MQECHHQGCGYDHDDLDLLDLEIAKYRPGTPDEIDFRIGPGLRAEQAAERVL